MKKITLWVTLVVLSMTGYSKTWSGMKQDTNEALGNTRDAIHEATAPVHTSVVRPSSTQMVETLSFVTQPVVATEQVSPEKVTTLQ